MAFSRALLYPSSRSWWDTWDYPSSILDQNFGMGLLDSDLLAPRMYCGYLLRPRTQSNIESSGESQVSNEADNFKVMLNVSHFNPKEIEVKTVDNFVVIHGKHEEKSDEHGFVSREFTRRYMLPEGVEPEKVKSFLSQDGVLTVEAPKKKLEPPPTNEHVIPITIETRAAVEDQK
ncbi:protein lethal(2)essential for life-like [Uloborus diversus]|uniref:protein lethal(2)essential for life-like n=1 Tax=Uloborus diversus TaxID=327109 RepID=UPI0024098544|nr:protein lethal(2)essential for life-like [Uloborus diversus]